MRAILFVTIQLSLCWGTLLYEKAYAAEQIFSGESLDAAGVEAIVQEASERHQKLGDNREDPVGPPWKTLTREKLEKLKRMPQFQKIGYPSHGLLIDQALAWDMVHFQNLSDIKRFFSK